MRWSQEWASLMREYGFLDEITGKPWSFERFNKLLFEGINEMLETKESFASAVNKLCDIEEKYGK